MSTIVFTCGDTNGIGPEISLKSIAKISKNTSHKIILVIPANVFREYSNLLSHSKYSMGKKVTQGEESIFILTTKDVKIDKGRPTKHSGNGAFCSIEMSYELLSQHKADAVVTSPISKTAINMAGINFPGHTEMYAEWCGVDKYLMTFLSKKMNAALATIHEPITRISSLINPSRLQDTFNIILKMMETDLNIDEPQIAVLGLNPHAGENGLIGKEEVNIINPLIKKYGNAFSGPYSPDAFFANKMYKNFDMVLGMYHDQILIPFKLLNFSTGVNYTAGLPIIRTSPDHGVAYDIAGRGIANEASMIEAFKYAETIIKNRKRNKHKN